MPGVVLRACPSSNRLETVASSRARVVAARRSAWVRRDGGRCPGRRERAGAEGARGRTEGMPEGYPVIKKVTSHFFYPYGRLLRGGGQCDEGGGNPDDAPPRGPSHVVSGERPGPLPRLLRRGSRPLGHSPTGARDSRRLVPRRCL